MACRLRADENRFVCAHDASQTAAIIYFEHVTYASVV
jgi:hypothetical protein